MPDERVSDGRLEALAKQYEKWRDTEFHRDTALALRELQGLRDKAKGLEDAMEAVIECKMRISSARTEMIASEGVASYLQDALAAYRKPIVEVGAGDE